MRSKAVQIYFPEHDADEWRQYQGQLPGTGGAEGSTQKSSTPLLKVISANLELESMELSALIGVHIVGYSSKSEVEW